MVFKTALYYIVSCLTLALVILGGLFLYKEVDSNLVISFYELNDYFNYLLSWVLLGLLISVGAVISSINTNSRIIEFFICVIAGVFFSIWKFVAFQSAYAGLAFWKVIGGCILGISIFFVNRLIRKKTSHF